MLWQRHQRSSRGIPGKNVDTVCGSTHTSNITSRLTACCTISYAMHISPPRVSSRHTTPSHMLLLIRWQRLMYEA